MLRRDLVQEGHDPLQIRRKKTEMQKHLIVETIWITCMATLLVWMIVNRSIPWLVSVSVLQLFLGILVTYVWSWHILVGYEKRHLQ